MVTGDRGKIHHQVTLLVTADDAFPMGDGLLFAVLEAQKSPDLRLTAEGKQRSAAPPQQNDRQKRCKDAENCKITFGKGKVSG
jgi:hypothetical protein